VVAGEQHVEIFDPATGQRLLQQKVAGSSEMNVRFTRDGRYLIESDYNGQGTGQGVRIWDGHRQKLIREIAGDVDSISVSRDSRYLAVGQYGGDVTVWEIK
jgi:WD40 repeat protein